MKALSFYLMLLPLSVMAQNTDSIVQDIRSEYKTIVDNKSNYKQIVVDVFYTYDGEGDGPDVSKTITYYVERDKIKLISVSNKWDVFWTAESEIIEYYMKNSNVFFIYQQIKDMGLPTEMYQMETRPTKAEERRIYYDESNQPFKCLTKKVEGKLPEIDTLLQKAGNKEGDCSQMQNIGKSLIYDFSEEDIDFLLECYQKYNSNEKIIIKKN